MNKHLKIIRVFLFFFLFSLTLNASEEINLEGIYKGENIYIENPYSITGVGFCVSEVLVNGNTTTDEIHSSFFEIDLSIYNFKYGDFVSIKIIHREGCKPRVLNKEVLTPESTFEIKFISIDKSAYLRWTTIKEHGSLPFIIEQFRWNKWIKVGQIKGKGTEQLNKYKFSVDFHSGKNKFRIKQIASNKKPRYSKTVEYTNNIPKITFIPGNGGKVTEKIFFSETTLYEIYDYFGIHIKSGSAAEINVSNLKSGTYFLNYDNKTETFIKK